MADDAVIDWQQAAELVGGSADIAKELLLQLHASLPQHMHSMQDALSANDLEALYDHVHRLYGGLCYCGVPQLRSTVLALKRACLAKDVDVMQVCYRRVLQAVKAFDEAIQ